MPWRSTSVAALEARSVALPPLLVAQAHQEGQDWLGKACRCQTQAGFLREGTLGTKVATSGTTSFGDDVLLRLALEQQLLRSRLLLHVIVLVLSATTGVL